MCVSFQGSENWNLKSIFPLWPSWPFYFYRRKISTFSSRFQSRDPFHFSSVERQKKVEEKQEVICIPNRFSSMAQPLSALEVKEGPKRSRGLTQEKVFREAIKTTMSSTKKSYLEKEIAKIR